MLIKFIIFCLLSMLYVHVAFQLKTCQDLEVYESTLTENLEEVCNVKQPVVFHYNEPALNWPFEEYQDYEIQVYDTKHVDVPLSLEKALKLFKKKDHATFHNTEFLKETMLHKCYTATDHLLRPPLVSSIQYDTLFGCENFTTKLQYHTSCRNFFIITQGSVIIKLTSPNKNMSEVKQYETHEFYSEVNPWTSSDKKIKYLTVTLTAGRMIFIPAYWWYSIKLEKDARVSILRYKTIMNTIATLPEICLGYLQRQNTLVKALPSFI